VIIAYGYYQQKTLESRKKITTGIITGTKIIKGVYITYDFSVGINSYSFTTVSNKISTEDIRKFLQCKTFPVIYDSLNISQSELLIFKEDFKNYGFTYPDSLKWVSDSLRLDNNE
jgi:hypothetical protein